MEPQERGCISGGFSTPCFKAGERACTVDRAALSHDSLCKRGGVPLRDAQGSNPSNAGPEGGFGIAKRPDVIAAVEDIFEVPYIKVVLENNRRRTWRQNCPAC